MSELERVLRNYSRTKHLEKDVRWVTRKDAAEYLGVSVKRVNQLVKEGRLRTLNRSRQGALNPVREEDVLSYTRKAKGRPKAMPGHPRAIPSVTSKFGFKLYQRVIYEHPTEFGYNARIPVKIIHFGPKKIFIEAVTKNNEEKTLWVYPRQLEAKKKKGENTMVFVRYEDYDTPDCALTICTPFQWNQYLKRWGKILTAPDDFLNFRKQFVVLPITQIMAARFSRFLGGRSFGKFPEYHAN